MTARRFPTLALLASLALAGSYPTSGFALQDEPAAAEIQAAPITVQRRDLVASFRATGRYEAETLQELMFDPQVYGGKLIVVEAIEPGTRVSRGEVVLRLQAEGLEEQLADAGFAVDKARLQLAWAREERELLVREHAIATERAKLALADAEQDWKLWEQVNKADQYLAAELDLASSQARLEDEREELRQLEELYKGAKLASQTQDIVLERARRSLVQREQWVQIELRRHQQQVEVALPRQERDLKNTLGWQRMQSEIATARMRMQLQKQDAEVATAERGLESAQRQLDKLKQDAASLKILASEEGIVTDLVLEPGDKVQANQALGKLIALSPTTVSLSIPATDLRVLDLGTEVSVRCVAFGELATAGKVTRIDTSGTPGSVAGGASFNVEVSLDESSAAIRPGMAALITAERTIKDALVVPRSAVQVDDKGSFVTVLTATGEARREVLLGAGNDELVQVVHGLSEGDTIKH